MQRAVECFEKAVAIDPDYAAAHLGIADVFAALGLWGMMPPAPAFTRVKAAAARALAIDDSLAAAHVVLGSALLLADWNWELARGHFQRAEGHLAAPTGPFSIGFYYFLAGRSADAFQYFHDVFEKDPLSAIERMQAATVHIARRELDAATTLLEEALDLDDQLPTALVWLGFCRGVQGRLDDALPLLSSAAERGIAMALPLLASVLAQVGAADRAHAVHAQLEQKAATRYVSPTCLALSHAALGHEDRCRDFLGRAEDDRSADYTMYLLGPGFVALYPEWLQRWFEDRRRQIGLLEDPPRRPIGR
jgi:adenylate cyclase